MKWCSYGFGSMTKTKDTRTKEQLRKETIELIAENSVLWLLLKEQNPDKSIDELSKMVDDKIQETQKEAELFVEIINKMKKEKADE